MTIAQRIARPAVGVLVIAHAWAHTVLPLRGLIAPETLSQNFMPLICYGTALLGFSAAGVGILGVWPFTLATRQLLVVASAYSLVSLEILGHSDLWWGAAIDVVLLLVGVTGLIWTPSGSGRGPAPPSARSGHGHRGGISRLYRHRGDVAGVSCVGDDGSRAWPGAAG